MKTNKNTARSIIATLTITSALSGISNAAIVNWSRVDTNNSSDTRATQTLSPTSGTLNTNSFSVGWGYYGGAEAEFDYNNPNNPFSNSGILSGETIEISTTFDQMLTGGNLKLSYAWQMNDYSIELIGGTGVIDASNVQFTNGWSGPNQTLGLDYNVTGDGTNAITLDSKLSNSSFFQGSISISGTWSGVKITQLHNDDTINSRFDPAVVLKVQGAEVVPEPSSTLLLGLGGLSLILRRKRG